MSTNESRQQKYIPEIIEPKWQKIWDEKKVYQVDIDRKKPKYYVLDMFPYPSGAGLHVGHVVGYTGSDVVARFKRQKGFNVLHPMGWDSFGLPAEQYAIRTGTHPQITTERNIETYKRQLKSLGLSYDWTRELATSDPQYYKWTQWIFTKLYEKGLAYEAEALVNFCPHLGTVLANEEVEDGKSVEGGYPVEKRPLKQWMFKITEYAEQLLEGLDDLEWPDSLKKIQRNWIGKSVGLNIQFSIDGHKDPIVCYTTRQDTLFGVTFLVLSPEHPLVDVITTKEHKDAINQYKEKSLQKGDLERTDLAKEKTGAFTGSYAINPVTKERIPIWIADYVLMSYATGAVMGVPSDDERDQEFANIYGIPIVSVIDEDGSYINSKSEEVDLSLCSSVNQAKDVMADLLVGKNIAERKVAYKLRDWLFSRQRYWGEPIPILHFSDGSKRSLDLDELPLTPPMVEDYKPSSDGSSPLARVKNWVQIQDPKTNKPAFRETNTMPQWAGSCWYYLRFCDPQNEKEAWSSEAEKYWLPVDLYIGGVEHAVLHLLYARFWHKVLYDLNLVSTKEPFQCLQNQGLITSMAYKLEGGGYIRLEEVEENDKGLFQKNTGKKVLQLVEKMSKSKLNGCSPDEIIEEFGADSLRLYELFMTPFDKEKLWQRDAISGCRRFLNRVYALVVSDKIQDKENKSANAIVHACIRDVEKDLDGLFFNTAIARLMETLNDLVSLDFIPKDLMKKYIQLIYPFAPHFAEECWEILGEKESIIFHPFPKWDASFMQKDSVTIVYQVMGRLRGKGSFSKGVSKETVLEDAKNNPNVSKHITGTIAKVIFVPDKLLNIVVS